MITIYQEKRLRNILIIFLFVILIATLFIFSLKKKSRVIFPEKSEFTLLYTKKIKIDWSILESPIFNELEEFPKIEKLKPEEIGRQNPFLPF